MVVRACASATFAALAGIMGARPARCPAGGGDPKSGSGGMCRPIVGSL